MPPNSRQRELARHALGLPNETDRSFRNRYLTSGDKAVAWRGMVAAGLAKEGEREKASTWFWLTRAGAEAALDPGESLCPEDFPPSPGPLFDRAAA